MSSILLTFAALECMVALVAALALAATLFQTVRAHSLPRDLIGGFSAVCGFLGITFVVAGVLAPGGGWIAAQGLLVSDSLAGGPEFIDGGNHGKHDAQ